MSDVLQLIPVLSRWVTFTDEGCWLWSGALDAQGYGRLSIAGRKSRLAYRYVYEVLVGPVLAGLELDHLCRRPACVNPRHLEPVTHQENVARGVSGAVNAARQLARTHCKRDHAYTPENTYIDSRGSRVCRVCRRDGMRQKRGAA